MKNLVIGFIIGLLIATAISAAFARVFPKYESQSPSVKSIVGYGKFEGTIVPILVDSEGRLLIR